METKKYECGNCGELHDWEDDAQECCLPEVKQVYVCEECEEVHETEFEADKCCADDDCFLMASPREREAAGQQRLPI